ncbi:MULTISPECIES: hypothetical protein [unclassified Arthrobacter]|uniref:hypothetical protein n=1 Tax=unclassified Arthrobacter TaxID=235627 RepID=UPI000B867B77|nr:MULTISPECIES: hypothetical protein [unclassified Arthrobacter]
MPGTTVAGEVRVTTVGSGTSGPAAVARGGGTAIARAAHKRVAIRMRKPVPADLAEESIVKISPKP